MSDRLQQPDEHGDIVDQTEADLTAGPSNVRPDDAGAVEGGAAPPGHPAAAAPAGTPGEATSRGGNTAAGPGSPTTGTGSGTGADRDERDVPPTAPG